MSKTCEPQTTPFARINEARQLARELRTGLEMIPVRKLADVLDGLCSSLELFADDLAAEKNITKALRENP